MNKALVLAEKPSVGRDLARVLNCNKKGNGYFEGDRYIVTWALGHLVTLADPEDYNNKYKTWNIDDLPIIPSEVKLVVIKQTGKQFHTVKEQLYRKDVNEVVIATDAGREGELVARWILEKAKVKKPIKRLWISSVTDKAIKDGFNKLKNGKEYENLFASAVARAEADWLIGLNASRALTTKYNAQLSCGRVQTPTLAMIAKREEEIQNFKSRTFYGIIAEADGFKLHWQDATTKDTKSFDKERVDSIMVSIKNKVGRITYVNKAYKKSYPPQLYDLTELQRDANRIFSFSAKETLSIMQGLYENHKLLTYPRTDSRYISTDILDTLKDRVKACGVGPYSSIASKIKGIVGNKSFVDNSKVSDHHAIIPTEERVLLGALNERERKIYDLVVKRFLAVLYPPFEYEETSIQAEIGNEVFITKGKTVLKEGWKQVYGTYKEEEEEGDSSLPDEMLPKVNKGDNIRITRITGTTGKTKPPAYFNEGTLLSAMENPKKYMEEADKNLVKMISETGGLGTVATRADIIEKLFSSFLIEKRGKDIFITGKGKQLLGLVPADLKSPILTAQWEEKLSAISKGGLKKEVFIKEMKDYTIEIVKEIKKSERVFTHDNLTRNKCPECGKYMLEINGKKGKLLICQDRECGERKSISKKTNTKCPNCNRFGMEIRGEGSSQTLVCKCGHVEKLTSFKERKEKDKDKANKKDVANYMKNQQKNNQSLINTALADALSKLKLD